MDESTQKIIVGFVCGSIGGSVLTYTVGRLEIYRKARRIRSALQAEFNSARGEVKEKLKWLSRDVSNELLNCDAIEIVNHEGRKLYLGEDEEFGVQLKYWEDKYCEIVEILGATDFARFAESHQLIASFVKKFSQMKKTFKTDSGNKQEMARACYQDLIDIGKKMGLGIPPESLPALSCSAVGKRLPCEESRVSAGSVSHRQTVDSGACTTPAPAATR